MLTREECLEAYEVIDTLIHLMCGETREDGYEPTMDETINSMRILKQLIDKHFEIAKEKECLEKALDKACELLEEQTEEGNLLCPCEYLGICHCMSTENGYECNGDNDYKWKEVLMKDVE